MNSPKPPRWLDEGGDGTPAERELLRSGLAMDPPPEAKDAVWNNLLAAIPGGLAGAAGAGAAGKAAGAAAGKASLIGAAAKGGMLSSILIGAGSAVVVIAGYTVVVPQEPNTPSAVVSARSPAGTVLTAVTAGSRADTAMTAKGVEPAPSADVVGRSIEAPRASAKRDAPADAPIETAASASAMDRASMVREESRAVGAAREALRSGDAAGALAQLDAIRARFPEGVLGQEREALTIEALYKSGRRSEASARAKQFVAANPSSAHTERLQAFIESSNDGGTRRVPPNPPEPR